MVVVAVAVAAAAAAAWQILAFGSRVCKWWMMVYSAYHHHSRRDRWENTGLYRTWWTGFVRVTTRGGLDRCDSKIVAT